MMAVRASRMAAVILILLGGVGASRGDSVEPSSVETSALLDRTDDRILARADIAARGGRHGEVRIVARGDARVVQTVLHSKLLRRVVFEIAERERTGWPEWAEGAEASRRYVAALARSEQAVPGPPPNVRLATADRRRALLIEFVLSRDAQLVAFFEPSLVDGPEGVAIEGVRPIERIALPRAFVEHDMRRIAQEHLPDAGERLGEWLAIPADGPQVGDER